MASGGQGGAAPSVVLARGWLRTPGACALAPEGHARPTVHRSRPVGGDRGHRERSTHGDRGPTTTGRDGGRSGTGGAVGAKAQAPGAEPPTDVDHSGRRPALSPTAPQLSPRRPAIQAPPQAEMPAAGESHPLRYDSQSSGTRSSGPGTDWSTGWCWGSARRGPRSRPSSMKSQYQSSPGSYDCDEAVAARHVVLGGVLHRRGVATADVPALGAAAQVHPPPPGCLALDAAGTAGSDGGIDAGGHVGNLRRQANTSGGGRHASG